MSRLARAWARRPLPMRVTVVVVAVCVVVFLGLARASVGAVEWAVRDAVDSQLTAALDAAAAAVREGRPAAAPPGTDITVRVLDRSGAPVDGGPPPQLRPQQLRELLSGEPAVAWGGPHGSGDPHRPGGSPVWWRGEVVTAPDGSQRLVVAGAEVLGYAALVARSGVLLAAVAVVALGVVGLASWFAARAALRPVRRMRLAAAELSAGERLPVPAAQDELRSLAEAINELLVRRDAAVERLRRFTDDAAHELRSPVASLRAQAEVGVLHSDPTLLSETLADVAAEVTRLSALLDNLLVLARVDSGQRLPIEPVDVIAAARDAVARHTTPDGPVIRLAAPADAAVHAAPSDVARVIDNLLDNAVRHTHDLVRLAVLPVADGVRVLVDDNGDGVPLEDRGRVFERFYRADPARDRETGGTGLGLSLVAETVRRYGGSAAVGDSPEGGARFEVRWPSGDPAG